MHRSLAFNLIVAAAVLCSAVVIAAPEPAMAGGDSWYWLNPLPRGDDLEAVDIAPNNPNVAYAVGANGVILKTYDSGANWVEKSTSPAESGKFYSVFAVSDQIAYVGGTGGVYKTSNGASFSKLTALVPTGYISALFFRNANLGWAADDGGKIWRTDDGGASWTAVTLAGTPDLTSIAFRDDANGYAVSGSTNQIFVTSDGGSSWQIKETKTGVYLIDIAFNPDNTQVGWIVGRDGTAAKAYRTSDGGTTWTEKATGLTYFPESVAFPPSGAAADTVWMTYFNQADGIVKVADGDAPVFTTVPYATWGQWQSLADIDASSPTAVLGVGAQGAVTFTKTGGAPWGDRAQVIGRNWLTDMHFLDMRTGYITSQDGGVWKTTNAGGKWINTLPTNTVPLHGLFFLDTNRGWAVGGSGRIFKTTDGGKAWTPQTSGVTTQLNAVVFVDATRGWISGASGIVLYTEDGGTTWTPRNAALGTTEYKDIDFISTTEGAVVGTGGKVFTTTNGGTTWTPAVLPAGASGTFNAVDYVSPQTFFVAGERMFTPTVEFSMLKTTTGGAGFGPWPYETHTAASEWGKHQQIYDMQWLDANQGFVLFQDGTVAKTTTGGGNMSASWTYQKAIDTAYHSDLSVVSASAMWLSGTNGRIKSTYKYYPTKVYRFYNFKNGTHFYTDNYAEKTNIITKLSHVFKYEGVGYEYDAYKATAPLYRFYNKVSQSHFYTPTLSEKESVIKNLSHIYTYEGPAYNVSTTPLPDGSNTVWRFYNRKNGSHFFTVSPAEVDSVKASLGHIYTYEGPAYYLPQ